MAVNIGAGLNIAPGYEPNLPRFDPGAIPANPAIGGLIASGAPQNALLQANQQQEQNILNQQRQVESATALQEAQNKQRQFQISMLNGVMSLPPEQQADALSKVIPMANRLGPVQFDENMTPSMAKMYVMSNVPAQAMPEYMMNQARAQFYTGLANAATGQQQNQPPISNPAQPAPHGTPMPQDGNINGAAPIPQGGGSPVQTSDIGGGIPESYKAVMPFFDPQASRALTEQERLQLENSPEQQARLAGAKKQGEAQTEATQTAQEGKTTTEEMNYNTRNLIDQANTLIKNHPDIANSPIALKVARTYQANNPNDQTKDIDTGISRLEELSSSNLLPSIRAFLKGTGQVRVFEGTHLDKIFGYDPNRSLQANVAKWQYAMQQVQLGQQGAENLRKALQTGQLYDVNPNAPEVKQWQQGNAGNAQQNPSVNQVQQGQQNNPQAQGQRIRVITPDGRMGTIDAAHLNELIAAGGKRM